MLTEGWALVIVDFKSVWHVNFESLLVELKERAEDVTLIRLGVLTLKVLADAQILQHSTDLKENMGTVCIVTIF